MANVILSELEADCFEQFFSNKNKHLAKELDINPNTIAQWKHHWRNGKPTLAAVHTVMSYMGWTYAGEVRAWTKNK